MTNFIDILKYFERYKFVNYKNTEITIYYNTKGEPTAIRLFRSISGETLSESLFRIIPDIRPVGHKNMFIYVSMRIMYSFNNGNHMFLMDSRNVYRLVREYIKFKEYVETFSKEELELLRRMQ